MEHEVKLLRNLIVLASVVAACNLPCVQEQEAGPVDEPARPGFEWTEFFGVASEFSDAPPRAAYPRSMLGDGSWHIPPPQQFIELNGAIGRVLDPVKRKNRNECMLVAHHGEVEGRIWWADGWSGEFKIIRFWSEPRTIDPSLAEVPRIAGGQLIHGIPTKNGKNPFAGDTCDCKMEAEGFFVCSEDVSKPVAEAIWLAIQRCDLETPSRSALPHWDGEEYALEFANWERSMLRRFFPSASRGEAAVCAGIVKEIVAKIDDAVRTGDAARLGSLDVQPTGGTSSQRSADLAK